MGRIVISDYRLACGETGIDVVAGLRKTFGSDLPALAVTGDTDPRIIRRLTREGIDVYHKPLDLDVLHRRIAELVARKRRPTAAPSNVELRREPVEVA